MATTSSALSNTICSKTFLMSSVIFITFLLIFLVTWFNLPNPVEKSAALEQGSSSKIKDVDLTKRDTSVPSEFMETTLENIVQYKKKKRLRKAKNVPVQKTTTPFTLAKPSQPIESSSEEEELENHFSVDEPNHLDYSTDFSEQLQNIPIRNGPTVGIENFGNICFASSVIQAIYRIPIVRKIIANLNVYKKAVNNNVESFTVLEGLSLMFNQLNSNEDIPAEFTFPRIEAEAETEEEVIQISSDPKKYYSALKCMPSSYVSYSEGSAVEFLDFIISRLRSILPSAQSQKFGLQHSNSNGDVETINHLNLLCSQSANKKPRKLESLIEYYLNDILGGGAFMDLKPEIIPVSINRATENNVNPVSLPEILDLAPYSWTKGDKSFKYKFMNIIIVHEDQTGTGSALNHYVAYIREKNGKYYRYDDSDVSEITEKVFKEKMLVSCICFYEKTK